MVTYIIYHNQLIVLLKLILDNIILWDPFRNEYNVLMFTAIYYNIIQVIRFD